MLWYDEGEASSGNGGHQKDEQAAAEVRTGPYRIYFYSYDCGEPRHMHVDRENRSAKFWLDLDVVLEENHGYDRKELRDIERILRENLGLEE